MTINQKLVFGFLGIFLTVLTASIIAVLQIHKVGKETVNIGERKLPLNSAVYALGEELNEARIIKEKVSLQSKPDLIEPLKKRFQVHLQKALFWADAIKKGNPSVKISKSNNRIVQSKITLAIEELNSFQKKGADLFESKYTSLKNEKLVHQKMDKIDQVYYRILEVITELERDVTQKNERQKKQVLNYQGFATQLEVSYEIIKDYVKTKELEQLPELDLDFSTITDDFEASIQQNFKELKSKGSEHFERFEIEKLDKVKKNNDEYARICRELITAQKIFLQNEKKLRETIEMFEKKQRQVKGLMSKTETAIHKEVRQSVVEAKDTQSSSVVMMSIFTLVFLTVTAGGGTLLARTMLKPLKLLTEGAKEIGGGNLEYKIQVDTKDELGILTSAFNNMASNLKKDINERMRVERELEEHKQNLEEIVEERTNELVSANKHLSDEVSERKRAEEELQQAFSKLKKTTEDLSKAEKLALVGETSGRVAHEVLNPITSIFSRVEHNINQWQNFEKTIDGTREIIADWQNEYNAGNLVEYLNKKENDDSKSYGEEDIELLNMLADKASAFQQERENDLQFIQKQVHPEFAHFFCWATN